MSSKIIKPKDQEGKLREGGGKSLTFLRKKIN